MGKTFYIPALDGKVLPPLPPFPKSQEPSIYTAGSFEANTVAGFAPDKIEQTVFGTPQQVPLKIKFKSETEYWLFPVEPLISIDGSNSIIKRKPAKKTGRGSIKEYWTQDDWAINIQGVLTTPNSEEFPAEDLRRLVEYCTANEPLDVACPHLERIGVSKMVIERYSLPFTKGPENQTFTITAVSDDDWQLLIKRNPNVL